MDPNQPTIVFNATVDNERCSLGISQLHNVDALQAEDSTRRLTVVRTTEPSILFDDVISISNNYGELTLQLSDFVLDGVPYSVDGVTKRDNHSTAWERTGDNTGIKAQIPFSSQSTVVECIISVTPDPNSGNGAPEGCGIIVISKPKDPPSAT